MKKKALLAIETIAGLLVFASPIYADEVAATIKIEPPSGFRITDIGKVIQAGFGLVLFVAGLLAFAYLLLGGIQWITSGGDKGGLEAARNKIIHAIVGLIVVFSAWAITLLVQNFLGYTIFGTLNIPKPY